MGPLGKTNTLQNMIFKLRKKFKVIELGKRINIFYTANFAIIYLYLIPTKPDIADRIVSGLFLIILPFNARKNQTESKMAYFKVKTERSGRRRTFKDKFFIFYPIV